MSAPNRIYVVTVIGDAADGNRKRLVRAINSAQAWRRVADELVTVELASQECLIEMVAAGAKVEDQAPTP
jgi:hypothetical protein